MGPSSFTARQMGKLRHMATERRGGLGVSHQLLWYFRLRMLGDSQQTGSDEMNLNPTGLWLPSEMPRASGDPASYPTHRNSVYRGWENRGLAQAWVLPCSPSHS